MNRSKLRDALVLTICAPGLVGLLVFGALVAALSARLPKSPVPTTLLDAIDEDMERRIREGELLQHAFRVAS